MRTTDRWLRPVGTAREGAPTLVCVPHAGGAADYYRPLLRPLVPHANVRVVEYPGHGDRSDEAPLSSVEALAERIAARLDSCTASPVTLFGHSLGALVGYEVAVRLTDRGRPPHALVVSGHGVTRPPWPNVPREIPDGVLLDQLRRYGGTDEVLLKRPELLRAQLPALRHDIRVARSYRHPPVQRLTCPVTALVGDADPYATAHAARGWAAFTTGRFELAVFPGGHFYLSSQRDQLVRVLSDRIASTYHLADHSRATSVPADLVDAGTT